MNELEAKVIEYLSQFSVVANKIEESNEKTPDFLVDQEERILIELKEKLDREDIHERKEEKLAQGEVFEYINTMGYRNRLAGVVGGGIEQLLAQKSNTDSEFCFLFIVASGVSPSNQLEKIASTLYGKKSVVDFDSDSGSQYAKSCYYAYHSEFYKHKEIIDGVFVATDYVYLLLNDKSPNYSRLKNSKFLSKLINGIHITDPIEQEKSGKAFIADCDIGRGNQDKIKEYVFEKYGIQRGLLIDFPHIIMQSRVDFDKI